jgi:hypothetical protein
VLELVIEDKGIAIGALRLAVADRPSDFILDQRLEAAERESGEVAR